MTNKSAPRKWQDLQIVIATVSLALTLVFWNLFAALDRLSAIKRAQERGVSATSQPMQTFGSTTIPSTTIQQSSNEKIFLGGSAPQTRILGQSNGGGNNSGGGTGSS